MATKIEEDLRNLELIKQSYRELLRLEEELGEEHLQTKLHRDTMLQQAKFILDTEVKTVEQYKILEEHLEGIKDSQEEYNEMQQHNYRLSRFMRNEVEKVYEIKAKEYKLEEDKLEYMRVSEKITKQEYEVRRDILNDTAKMYQNQIDITKQTKLMVTASTGLRSQYGGLVEAARLIGKTRGGFRAMGAGIASVLNPMSLLLNLFQMHVDRIKELDVARTSFNLQTGAVNRYKEQLEDAYRSNIRYNVSLQEMSGSFASLHKEMTTFSGMSQKAQMDIAGFTAKLRKNLGVDAVGGLETLSRVMGQTGDQAKDTFTSMIEEADQFNLNIQEVGNGLISNANNIALYGKRGVKVYMELAKRSKTLGIEMGKLHAMSEQFLDFGAAARMSATLAQYAGKQVLSASKLITADAEERVDMITGAVRKLGNFEKMTAQERMDIARSMGVSTADLAKMMRGEKTEAQERQETQRNLNTILKQSITVADNMTNAWKNMVQALGPLLDIMRWVVGVFADFMALGGGLMGKIILIGGALIWLASKILALVPPIKILGATVSLSTLPFTLFLAAILAIAVAAIYFREEILGAFTYVFESLGDMFSDAYEWMKDAGYNMVKFLADGIWSAVTLPVRAIKSVVGKIRGFLPFSPAKEGPLKDIMDVGPNIVRFIGNGIDANQDMVTEPMNRLAGDIMHSSITSPTSMDVGPNIVRFIGNGIDANQDMVTGPMNRLAGDIMHSSITSPTSITKAMESTTSDIKNREVNDFRKAITTSSNVDNSSSSSTAGDTNVVNGGAPGQPVIIQLKIDSKVIKEIALDEIMKQTKLSNVFSTYN